MPTLDVVMTEIKATKAAINAALKAEVGRKDLDMGFFKDFAKLLRESREDMLSADKFKNFCSSGELGNNLDMWKDEGYNATQMLEEFDKEFEKYTPVAQPTYGSSGVPSILQSGLGRSCPAGGTPSTATPSVTPDDSAAGASTASGTPLSVTPPSHAANGGVSGDSKPTKDPTKTLLNRLSDGKGLNSALYKNWQVPGELVYESLKQAHAIDHQLEEDKKPPKDGAETDPDLAKLSQQVETAKGLVDARVNHKKDVEAKLRALDTKITLNQGNSFAGRGRMERLKEQAEEIWSQWLQESTKVEAIDKLIKADESEKAVLETAAEEAKAAVEGAEHQKLVANLQTLQGDYNTCANKGKLNDGQIKAMKEERKRLYEVIFTEVEELKTVVVNKYTKTDPKDVKIIFGGPNLPPVQPLTAKSGERILKIVPPTMGNQNCGTRATLESLEGGPINLAANKKSGKTVDKTADNGAAGAAGDVDMHESVATEEGEIENMQEDGAAAASGGKKKPGRPKGSGKRENVVDGNREKGRANGIWGKSTKTPAEKAVALKDKGVNKKPKQKKGD